MKIESTWVSGTNGQTVHAVWEDCNSFPIGFDKKMNSVRGVCFYGDKMVIIKDDHGWQPPCGGIEIGETVEEALAREVQEESNMKILKHSLLGFMKSKDDHEEVYQARYYCEVEPYGPFISDPDGGVTEIKLIDSKDYKDYFNWGKSFERAMELIEEIRSLKQ